MDFNKILLLIVSLSCILLRAHTVAVAPSFGPRKIRPPQAMVMNLCKNSTNPRLCIRTILPQMKGAFDPYKALEAEVNATMTQAKATLQVIKTHLAKPDTTKPLADSLSICKEQYGYMVDTLEQALKEVTNRSLATGSKYRMGAVISYHSACIDNFGKEVSPISKEQQLLKELAGNCLDIIHELEVREQRRVLRRFGNKLPPPPPAVTSNKNDPCFNVIGICGIY